MEKEGTKNHPPFIKTERLHAADPFQTR